VTDDDYESFAKRMADSKLVLTTGPHPRKPGKLIAVLSRGSPQRGDDDVMVLSVEVVDDMQAAFVWANKAIQSEPWETRQ